MQLLDEDLFRLIQQGAVDGKEALIKVNNPRELELRIQRKIK